MSTLGNELIARCRPEINKIWAEYLKTYLRRDEDFVFNPANQRLRSVPREFLPLDWPVSWTREFIAHGCRSRDGYMTFENAIATRYYMVFYFAATTKQRESVGLDDLLDTIIKREIVRLTFETPAVVEGRTETEPVAATTNNTEHAIYFSLASRCEEVAA